MSSTNSIRDPSAHLQQVTGGGCSLPSESGQQATPTHNYSEGNIMSIQLENVMSVYSGRVGSCCCGCSGKHTYAKAHQKAASKSRGYAVTDDEVNDKTVKLVVGKMNKEEKLDDDADDVKSVTVGNRLYVAYLVRS